MKMRQEKKFGRRLLAGVMCAAMLTGTAAVQMQPDMTASAADYDYTGALEMSLYFYDANECGSEVDDNCLTWRGNCHTYDAEASLDNAQGLSSASKAAIMEQNGGSPTVDVSGGYHDAGDHIKFSMTMGFSASSLGWSYFSYPEAYENAGCTDHLLAILRHACDYFMKVTYLDANDDVIAFCYQVASEGEDHGTWSAPESQTMNRTTYWADASHPSADASGQMAAALATTALAFKDKDAAYSAECLKYANALAEFTKKYPQATYDGVGSMYASGSQTDDIAWSELWCAIANNGGTLPSSFNPTYKLTGQGCYNNDQYDGWMYSWDKVWSGYAALLAEVGYEQNTYLEEMKSSLNKQGGLTTSKYNAAGWGASRYNCALQMLALHIADITNDTSYVEAAKYQMDYILGNNPTGYSFLSGYGNSWPTHIHHRAANPDNGSCKFTLYGGLIGGPDSSGNYEDVTSAYQFTEPALDYNGCYALAIAGLASRYAGDPDAADKIAESASEIVYPYTFGDGEVTPPTTEETTVPPTTEEPFTEPPTTEELNSLYVSITPNPLNVGEEAQVYMQAYYGTVDSYRIEDESVAAITQNDTNNTILNLKIKGVSAGTTNLIVERSGETFYYPIEVVSSGTSETKPVYGDVTCDGNVDILDVILLNKALLAGETISDQGTINADVDLSGTPDSADSLTILKYTIKLETSLPVQKSAQ